MTVDDTPLAEQRCINCGSTELQQDTNGVWHCDFCRSTFRADDPAMIVVDSTNVQQANENVVDTGDMLTFEQQEDVSAHLRKVRDRSDVVVVVETVNTITENVEYYARRRAGELGVGDAAKDNGLYILLVREPRRIQVQAGNGVSTYLNSDDINRVVANSVVPVLKSGDIPGGLTTAADELVNTYLDNKATNNVRTDSRASGESSSTNGSRYRSSSSNTRRRRKGSPLATLAPFIFVLVILFVSNLNGCGGWTSSGGDSSYNSGYDSGGWDSGGWDSGGGSDFGGGGFDSGSGGGADW